MSSLTSLRNFFSITSKFLILYIKCSLSFLFRLPALLLIIYWRILQDGKALSTLYCAILAPLSYIKDLWEEDLGMVISDGDWESVLHRIHKCSVCERHGLLLCKIVHHVHWTKLKLSKHFQHIDPACNCFSFIPDSHSHMFWFYIKLRSFCAIIFFLYFFFFR